MIQPPTLAPLLAALAPALLALAAPAAAQETAEQPELSAEEELERAENDTTIVVTGQNEQVTVRQIQRQARDIAVRTGSVFESPLARFEDRLCPGIMGLETDFAARLIDRIRANAAELDIRILPDECKPNFIVAFVEDGEAMMRQMMADRPGEFEFLNEGQKAAILEPGPARVWATVMPRTLTGMPIGQVRDLGNPPAMQVFGAHSRIYTTIRHDITAVMVVFDRDAVRGMSLGQLADYATMRGLAQVRPSGDLSIDTILSLFARAPEGSGWAPPQRLTEFDRAYLRSLYDYIPNLPAARKLAAVGKEMRRIAEGQAEGASAGEGGE